jgi:hypothetical protein
MARLGPARVHLGIPLIEAMQTRYVKRRETGRRLKVQVLYGEGLASHTGPESCVAVREDRCEALTGECVGQPLVRQAKLA